MEIQMKVSKKVLVVDDMATIRHSLKLYLQPEGFKVSEAKSAEEALVQVNTVRPDIIIMDVIMDGMSGLDCCAMLKENPLTRSIPVIILTTLGKHEQKQKAFAAGCDSYLTKPVNKDRLLGKIWLLMRLDSKNVNNKSLATF
jgi:CheY-like chemotaxis protein